jgi:nuclease HARBI1
MQRNSQRSRVETQDRQLSLILRICFRRWGSGLRFWGIRKISELRHEIDLQNLHRSRVLSVRFDFSKLSDQQALIRFRFRKPHIEKIARLIPYALDMDGYLRTERRRYSATAIETTCILLRRLATPCRWVDLTTEFGRHPSNLSENFYHCLDTFYNTFRTLTEGWPDIFVRERAETYAKAISDRGAALPRTIGFIDGTTLTIARPSGMRQRATYSGHKRRNCLKFQAVAAPDGLLLGLYGPTEGRRHDMSMYSESGIDTMLANSLLIQNQQYYIYGDSAYALRPYLQVAFRGADISPEQLEFNTSMNTVRTAVEWMFKDIKQYFTHVAFSRKMQLRVNAPGKWYHVAAILWNFRVCTYGNPTSTYFDCSPPTLDDYLHSILP